MNKNDKWLREHLTRKGEPKRSYSTYSSAKRALERIENKDDLHIYLCSFCQKYHIGHLTLAQRVVKAEAELDTLRSYNIPDLLKELEDTKKERDNLRKSPQARSEITILSKKIRDLKKLRDDLLLRLGRYERVEPLKFDGPETRRIRVGSIIQLTNGTYQEVLSYDQYRVRYNDPSGRVIEVPLDGFRRVKY